MSLLDKLHDKALTTKKNHMKYPLIIASGIADWFAGTADEVKGHGEAAKASGEEMDYKLFEGGVKGAAMGEIGAYAAAVYTRNMIGLPIGVDLIVRDTSLFASMIKRTKQARAGQPLSDLNFTGLIGTVRTLAYMLANRAGRSDTEADDEPVEYDDEEEMPPVFPDPLPDPLQEDELRIMEDVEPEEDLPETLEGEELLPTDFEPLPSHKLELLSDPELEPLSGPKLGLLSGPELEPFDPEPVQLPSSDERYSFPDILEPGAEAVPDTTPATQAAKDYSLTEKTLEPEDDEPLIEDTLEAPPSSKPEVDLGPLGQSYKGPEATEGDEPTPVLEAEPEPEDDEEDPLSFVEEDDSGNELF